MWGHSRKAATDKPKREALGAADPAGTLSLGLQAPELWEDRFVLFKPPSLWGSVVAAQADKHTILQLQSAGQAELLCVEEENRPPQHGKRFKDVSPMVSWCE